MSQVFFIGLALASSVFFFVQFRCAFFSENKRVKEDWFGPLDVSLAVLISVLLGMVAVQTFSTPDRSFSEKDISGSFASQLLMATFVIVYVWLRKIPLKEFFGFRRREAWPQLRLAGWLIAGIAPMVLVVASACDQGPSGNQEVVKFFRESTSTSGRLLLASVAIIAAPVGEELVFRGFLYRILSGYFGKIAAMIFTSFLFASIHGNIPTLLPLTLLALGLTIGLELSGSLFVSIAMHGLFNAISLFSIFLDSAK